MRRRVNTDDESRWFIAPDIVAKRPRGHKLPMIKWLLNRKRLPFELGLRTTPRGKRRVRLINLDVYDAYLEKRAADHALLNIARKAAAHDPRKLNHRQIQEMFPGRFSREFLQRYSKLWHPKKIKPQARPHPDLERWIICGWRPPKEPGPPEQWFWLADLKKLAKNINLRQD